MQTKIFFSFLICGLLFSNQIVRATQTIDKHQVKKQDAQQTRLIRLAGDQAVYYQAVNGWRYVFPNDKIYFSWFTNFDNVVTIRAEEFGNILIGGTVKYKPNSRLVKITTDPKVYWVDKIGTLRHVNSETLANQLFGAEWAKKIDDLSDSFFAGYEIGEPIVNAILPELDSDWQIDDNEDLYLAEDNSVGEDFNTDNENNTTTVPAIVDEAEQPSDMNLTVWSESGTAEFKWIATGGNTKYGVALIKSTTNEIPIYNTDETVKVSDITADRYSWYNLSNGAYYFSACRINSDGSCGKMTAAQSVAIGVTEKISSIELSGKVENGIAKLTWKTNWISPNDGFYLVRSDLENPRYSHDMGVWISKTSKSYNWAGLSFGTKHFRLCRYTGTVTDLCKDYSNDLELEIK